MKSKILLIGITLAVLFLLLSILPLASRYSHSGDIRIFYQDYGRKDAPAIVFIHGWSCDHTVWRLQVPELRKDYRLIIVDLPGCGLSSKPANTAYTPEYLAEAVNSVMSDAGIKRAVLAGHSSGFAVARRFAIRYPDKTAAICDVDGVFMDLAWDPKALEMFKSEMDTFMKGLNGKDRDEFVRWFVNMTFYGKTPEPLQKEIMALMTKADAHAANSAMEEMWRPREWERAVVKAPMLAIYAKIPELPTDEEAQLRAQFPNLTYVEWGDTGHFLMMQHPERFNKLLSDFVKHLKPCNF
ncbi:MAG: alpha/beta hydrolase [Candidatus Omnitrophota bacterium]|jgi:pimeloyl-ACP methyl ester carboxylesterase